MNVAKLKVGTKVALADGSVGEVLVVTEDGSAVRVRYLDTMGEPELVGTEQLVPADDVLGVLEGTHTEGAT